MNKAIKASKQNAGIKPANSYARIRNMLCICGLVLTGCLIPVFSSVYLFKKSEITPEILLALIITAASTLVPSLIVAVRAEYICLKHNCPAEHKENKQIPSLPENSCFWLRYLPICANNISPFPERNDAHYGKSSNLSTNIELVSSNSIAFSISAYDK